jgi:hypothetical protein
LLVQKLLALLRSSLGSNLAEKLAANLVSELGSNLVSNLAPNLDLNLNLNLARILVLNLPPRQSLGRPLHGRIVTLVQGHTIPCGHGSPDPEYSRVIRLLIKRILSLAPISP